MKTPITSINMLPPIITFLSSHYELGCSYPLTMAIFVNGKPWYFIIEPREYWKEAIFDEKYTNGIPLKYFEVCGLKAESMKVIVTRLTGHSEFIFYLRDDYDTRFLEMLGIDQIKARDIALIDTFNNYEERHSEILKRIKQQQLDMYSARDVVEVLGQQTFDNLKYQSVEELLTVCRDNQPRW